MSDELTLERGSDQRRGIDVHHLHVTLAQSVAFEDRAEQGRLRRTGLYGKRLALQVLDLGDVGLGQRHDREAVGLQDRGEDAQGATLGTDRHHSGGVGVAEVAVPLGDERGSGPRALSLLDGHVQAGVGVIAFGLGEHEARIGTASDEVQCQGDLLERPIRSVAGSGILVAGCSTPTAARREAEDSGQCESGQPASACTCPLLRVIGLHGSRFLSLPGHDKPLDELDDIGEEEAHDTQDDHDAEDERGVEVARRAQQEVAQARL